MKKILILLFIIFIFLLSFACSRTSPTALAVSTATINATATAQMQQTVNALQTAGPAAQQTATMTAIFVVKWGQTGTGNGEFAGFIFGIGVDKSGNLYVADTGNNRVLKYDSSCVYVTQWGGTAPNYAPGSANGQLNAPLGIAADNSGNIYVVDTQNNRIEKFDSSGAYLTQWGGLSVGTGNGQFNSPAALAVDNAGNVYVVDTGNIRIQKFDSSGT